MLAKTKTNDIIEQLNELRVGDKSNNFLLRRFKRDAEALKQDSPVEAYEILAAIACLEVSVDDMHCFHKAAMTASGHALSTVVNYAMSLGKLGFLVEAQRLFKQAFTKEPTSLNMRYYARSSLLAGRVLEANDCVANMVADNIEVEAVNVNDLATIPVAADIIAKGGVVDDDVALAVACVERCLHRRNIFAGQHEVTAFAADNFILYTYIFEFDADALEELDDEVELELAAVGVNKAVLDMLEFDFISSAREQVAQSIVSISAEKMALVRDLVAHVEI